MEQVVKIVFLLVIVLAPLGVLSSLSLNRAGGRAAAAQNKRRAFELKTRARWRLVGAVLDCLSGSVGYYVVSRRVFPRIDVIWIFSAFILPPAILQIWFRLNWSSRKNQQLLTQMPTQKPSESQ
jgi:hypothetical protein